MKEIEQIAKTKEMTHKIAAEEWLSDSNRDTELKSEYLRAHLTSRDFEKLEKEIPLSQRKKVLKLLDKKTNARLFRRIAQVNKLPSDFVSRLTSESFDYQSFTFPKRGEKITLGWPASEIHQYPLGGEWEVVFTKPFEMQVTAVTQAQWVLIMGKNPSILNGAEPIEINGVKVDANRPVVNVSWNDVQEYVKRLNAMDPKYNYRLPTAAEWEYAARGGTKFKFSFGNNESELGEHAWFDENAGGTTHDVAELKPNPFALYDVHGNVWEWVQDWHSDEKPTRGTDPQGPSSGVHRALRGGSWANTAQYLSNEVRTHRGHPNSKGVAWGFRLVRTAK